MRALCAFNNLNIVKEVYRKKENWEKQEADEELWVCVGGGRGWQEVLGLWMGMWERGGGCLEGEGGGRGFWGQELKTEEVATHQPRLLIPPLGGSYFTIQGHF